MADTDQQTNGQAMWNTLVNRLGAMIGPAQPAGVLSGAATAGGIPQAVPTTAVPVAQTAPVPAAPSAPAAKPIPSVNQQLATQDAARQVAGQQLVASSPIYNASSTNAVQAAPRSGGGGAPVPPYAGNGRFTDPSAAIANGINQQSGYANQLMQTALNYIGQGKDIFDQATRGRAIAGILHAVAGNNNFAGVQGQGVDALNNAIAGITSAGIYGGAQMYGANQQLAGTQAQIAGQLQLEGGHTQPIGTEPVNTAYGPIPMTTYGIINRAPGGMVSVTPVGPSAERRTQVPAGTKVKQPDGTYTLQNGQTVTVKNGAVQ